MQRLLDFKKYSAAKRAVTGKESFNTFTTSYLTEMKNAIDRRNPTTIVELQKVLDSLNEQDTRSTTSEGVISDDETRYNGEFDVLQRSFRDGGNRGDVKRNHKRVEMGGVRP